MESMNWIDIHFAAKGLLPRLRKHLPGLEEYVLLSKGKFGKFIMSLSRLRKREQAIFDECIKGVGALVGEMKDPDYDKAIHRVVGARKHLLSREKQELFEKLLGAHFANHGIVKRGRRDLRVDIYRGGKLVSSQPFI